jgi:hypothetical protein
MILYCLKSTTNTTTNFGLLRNYVYMLYPKNFVLCSTRYFTCLRIKLTSLRWCNLHARLVSNIQVISYVIRPIKIKGKIGLGNTFVELFYFNIFVCEFVTEGNLISFRNHVYFCLCLGTN